MKNYLIIFMAITAATTASAQQYSLKEADANAFKMGCALNEAIVSGEDKASQELVKQHFNTITVENVMKAALVNPEPGVFKWQPADDFVAFGEANKLFI